MKRITYLGPQNSYSHIAAKKMFPHGYSFTLCKTFSDIIAVVETDKNAIGILPIENSTTSNIHENIDYVFSNRVHIIAEAYLHIHLHLIGLPQSTVSTIRTVYSHPKALLQCSTFIRQHHFKSLETTSTSEARTIVMKKTILLLRVSAVKILLMKRR